MGNSHEEVSQAVLRMAVEAFNPADVKRNTNRPVRPDPGGNVVVRDGDMGEPEVLMSPLTYIYTRRFVLEILPFTNGDPDYAQVRMLEPFGVAIERDRTLGGLADWIEPEAPMVDDADVPGSPGLRWIEVGLLVTYATSNPLG